MKRYLSATSLTLIGILVLATVLRLLHLGRESLWFDEFVSVAVVRLDWITFFRVLYRYEANMALYYCLLHLWIYLGESEFALRSLSALAGVLSVAAVYVIGKRTFGTKVALIGAALLATNAFDIQYSQEARSYSLLVLLSALSSLFFLKAIERSSRKAWAGYILTATLAVYTHFFGLLVLEAQWAALVFVRPRKVLSRGFLVSVLIIGVFLAPLAVFSLIHGTAQIFWVPKLSARRIYGLVDYLVGGGRLLVLAYLVACGIGAVAALRAWFYSKDSDETWMYAFLLSWLLVPILSVIGVSLWKPLFVDRYFIICLPPLALLAAVGVSQVRPKWIFVGSLVVLLSLSVRADLWYYSYVHKEDWRDATAYLISHESPKDGILFYSGTGRFGFDYYVRRLNPATETGQIAFPEPYDWTRTWLENEQPSDSAVEAMPGSYERMWLVLTHNNYFPKNQAETNEIETMLQHAYPNVERQDFRDVHVLLYSRSDGHEDH